MAVRKKDGRVVSFINMKGGVGKTTLAVGLSWELAADHRVLLVDVDPQFNATQWLVEYDAYLEWLKAKHTVFDVYLPADTSSGIGGFSRRKSSKRATLESNCDAGVKRRYDARYPSIES